MTGETRADTNTENIPSNADAAAANAASLRTEHAHTKKNSWLFDAAVYAGVVNTAVFLLSVLVTYKTNYGPKEGFWRKRGDITKQWTANQFQHLLKMSPTGAKNSANDFMMVVWSFVDGSLLAPVAAWFETKRPNEPEEQTKAQRGLKSLILGRAGTALIVVPTAIALDKTGLNNTLLNKPGKKLGILVNNFLSKHTLFPSLTEKMVINNSGKPIKFLEAVGKIGTFELFYTSVCTLGLWVSSKWIANLFHHQHPNNEIKSPAADSVRDVAATSDSEPTASKLWADKTKPATPTRMAPKESFVARAEETSPSHAAPAM